ncbi:MAG: response regulator [Pseudomonadota bacterium]
MGLKDVLRVLVVDDMSTSRGILVQALDSLGIQTVEYAEDGKQGMLRAKQMLPHLIISDLYMPELNGLQLLQHLRHEPTTKKIGFILVTGRADTQVIQAGKALGMNNFIPKPFTVADIKNSIESVVGRL